MASLETKLAVLAIFLVVHGIASWKRWYYKKPSIDTITHFLGGLTVGAFVKDWSVAFALIICWEFIEMVLIRENRMTFREHPLNKARDVLMGLLGFLIGVDIL